MENLDVQQIGRYRILDVIGKGGMGIVYRAIDTTIDRPVAIKMLLGEGEQRDGDLLARFYREVRSTANLQHKNIVTVYALDDFEGLPYMVMEYLEGQSIAQMIAGRQPVSIIDKIALICQVCEGLQYAHERNVIHRDVKPANILVMKDGIAKIVDFGIARVGRQDNLTRTGQIVGSIYYMSPEQTTGVFDSRSDIYSTGVTLFEFLTGEVPYKGSDTQSTLLKILHDPIPPLSKYLSNYPIALEGILSRAMAREAGDRYQTAEDFGYDLAQLLDGLKREMTDEFLAHAKSAMEERSWEVARQKLQEILRLDRRNRPANDLYKIVREQIQLQQRSQQIEQLRSQAEIALAGLQYEEALECIEQAKRLAPEDQDLLAFAASVSEKIEKIRTIGEALRRGQAALYAGDLREALSAVQQALELDQDHTEARTLDSVIKRELAERERQSQLQSYVEQARRSISNRDFLAALHSLQEAKSIDPTDSNIQELLSWAVRGHEQEKQRQALQQAIDQISKLIGDAKFPEALQLGQELGSQFPDDETIAKLTRLAERQIELQELKQAAERLGFTARQLIDNDRSDEAISFLEDGLKSLPGEPTLETLLAIARSELERKNIEREEAERGIRALAEEPGLEASHGKDRQGILVCLRSLHSGLARKQPMNQLGEVAAQLEQYTTSAAPNAEVSADINRALSEYRLRRAKWTKDLEELRGVNTSLRDLRNIESIEALVDKCRLLSTQYENDREVTAEWESIAAAAEQQKRDRDGVSSQAAELLRAMQAETQLDKLLIVQAQIDKLCAPWHNDSLIASLANQAASLVSDLRERKDQILRDLADLTNSIGTARSTGQIGLIQEHARMLAAEVNHADVRHALDKLEKSGASKLQELNNALAALRSLVADVETAKSLSEVEQYEAAARKYQERAESNQEISELLATIERVASVRRRDHARTENSLNQLVASAGKAPDQAALDLILARARDLLKRYGGDPLIKALGEQLEAVVSDRRARLASETAARLQTLDEGEELFDLDSNTGALAEPPPLKDQTTKGAERHRGRSRIYIVAATVCAVGVAAVGAYVILPRNVMITTTPLGAKVRVDTKVCNSPCILKLKPGRHDLTVTRAGYLDLQKTIEVGFFGAKSEELTLSAVSPPPASPSDVRTASNLVPNASILVRTGIADALVFIDDMKAARDKTGPKGEVKIETSSGQHQILVEKSGYETPSIRTVEARDKKTVVADFSLRVIAAAQSAHSGAASVAPSALGASGVSQTPGQQRTPPLPPVQNSFLTIEAPAGAEIHIDGSVIGHSAGGPIKAPVLPGPRTVEVLLQGFQPFRQIVNVIAGEQPNVLVKLAPLPAATPGNTVTGVRNNLPDVPSTPAVSQKDRTAIQDLLNRYAEAYDQRNLKTIQSLWTSIPSDEVRTIKEFFRSSKSIEMRIQMSNAVPAGDRILVECNQTLRFNMDGKQQGRTVPKTIYVKRDTNNGWIIDYIPTT